jgi:hypothetical protein
MLQKLNTEIILFFNFILHVYICLHVYTLFVPPPPI